MPQSREVETVIERTVAEVIDATTPGLRAAIVRRLVAEIQSLAPAPGSSPTDILNAGVASLQEVNSQVEILRRLLECGARFAGRVALFVAKGSALTGWQGTGFADNDFVKTVSLNSSSSLVARVIQERATVSGSTAEFDAGFMAAIAAPAEDVCLVLPLVVKEKVAALIYADGGRAPGGAWDISALCVLTRCAAVWLELSALRRQAPAAADEMQMQALTPEVAASPVAPAATDPELHRKARRFAKLLVEEIKLYNQPRVVEGKLNRDLYERLRDDIEKSRATYDKRYRETPVASADYFNEELIRILADNDVSLLGQSFQR